MDQISTKPLYELRRNDLTEVVVSGIAIFLDPAQGLKISDPSHLTTPIFARSLLKPWQFYACDTFRDEPYWSLGLASHSGEPIHLQALEQLYTKEGLQPSDLVCPASFPMSEDEKFRLIFAKAEKRSLYHPCSGKHLSFLSACKHGHLPKDYASPHHPLQQKLKKLIDEISEEKAIAGTDSCGVPTLALSMPAHARLWQWLASNPSERAHLLRKLWVENPNLVGGTKRLDSGIVRAGAGGVLAKEGAEGLLAIQTIKNNPQTLIVKIWSGFNPAQLCLASLVTLEAHKKILNPEMQQVLAHLQQQQPNFLARDQLLATQARFS